MGEGLRTFLASMTAYSSEGLRLLKSAYSDIGEQMEITRTSSVYRVRGKEYRPDHIHDIRTVMTFEGLSVALELQARMEPKQVVRFFRTIEQKQKTEQLHRGLSLNLLLFEDQTCMTPEVTIPHPDFHRRAEFAVPAAEIWGERTHPVLGKSLYFVAQSFAEKDWGEFFSQGQSLLDF